MNDALNRYQDWLRSTALSQSQLEELQQLDEDDIMERFGQELSFGTGGLRGILGLGTGRINMYTIRKATQGLANHLKQAGVGGRGVAIAYDSRHQSEELALEVALVLAANGIRAHLFTSLSPTPELSFAVRYLGCAAGIVITASHNPKEYNGYKVYGADGSQITLERAESIKREMEKVAIFEVVPVLKKSAEESGLLVYLGEDMDEHYLEEVVRLCEEPGTSETAAVRLKVVYTPLHGSGLKLVHAALERLGHEVLLVESQSEPDGDFPTVDTPNPENASSLSEGIKLAGDTQADLVLGTDPDCDRLGVAVRTEEGGYRLLSGNQIGALLVWYLLERKEEVSPRDAVVKTIVTSELGAEIARSYGATVFDTLTGFKFIGEKIKEFEEQGDFDFLFGYEESYGYLAGTFVRDKDAVIASALFCQLAADLKLEGNNIGRKLEELYREYGYYAEDLLSFSYPGLAGQKTMAEKVSRFRELEILLKLYPDMTIFEDYSTGKRIYLPVHQAEEMDLPKADVIKARFLDGSWLAVRPSGTEPKLKVYLSAVAGSKLSATERLNDIKKRVATILQG
jgi:phosphoglucomutase